MRNALHSGLFLILFVLGSGLQLFGQTKPVKAQVWAMRGGAIYAAPGEAPRQLNVGTALPEGTVIQTGHNAAVDIRLGKEAGMIRMPENSSVSFTRLSAVDERVGNRVELELHVQAGNLLGDVPRLPAGSKYYVKTSTGISGVREGQFRINAQGFVVLLQGEVLVAHIPPTGAPVPHPLTAPPPTYFSPLEGVKPAPPPLVQEVRTQLNARLRSP